MDTHHLLPRYDYPFPVTSCPVSECVLRILWYSEFIVYFTWDKGLNMDFKTIVIAWIAYLFVKYEHPDFTVNVAVDLLAKIDSVSRPTALFILSAIDFYSEHYYLWIGTVIFVVLLINFCIGAARSGSRLGLD